MNIWKKANAANVFYLRSHFDWLVLLSYFQAKPILFLTLPWRATKTAVIANVESAFAIANLKRSLVVCPLIGSYNDGYGVGQY